MGIWVVWGSWGGGSNRTFSGKLSLALFPLNLRAASSYALAAATAVSNVPNHTLAALWGSLISAAHFPHGLCLTPLYLILLSPVSSFDAVTAVAGVWLVVVRVVLGLVVLVVVTMFVLGSSAAVVIEDESP